MGIPGSVTIFVIVYHLTLGLLLAFVTSAPSVGDISGSRGSTDVLQAFATVSDSHPGHKM